MSAAEVEAAIGGHTVPHGRLERVLDALVRSGRVVEVEPGRFASRPARDIIVGKLSMTRKGYGFVETLGGDIYVGARDLAGAMHRDIVAVRVHAKRSREGRSGEIAYVVERANERIVGTLEKHGPVGLVVPTDRRLRGDVFVDGRTFGDARHGDVVVVRVTRWPSLHEAAQGVIEEVLGKPGDPGVDVEIVIREHALRTAFPEAVLEAAEGLTSGVDAALAAGGREDIRDWFTVTIDPADARDHDDAISLTREGGGFRLGVHIADVSHYVPWEGAIDREATLRGTSVYLVDRVLPMLPEQLSNRICSLRPDEDKLSMSVVMDLDKTGLVESYRIFPSVMRSDRRLSYDQVDAWLSGDEPFPDETTQRLLEDFRDVAAAVGKRRVDRGGLDFETVEAKVRLDDEGSPTEVVLRQRTVATNMIEEAMILANEVVASHMVANEAPMVFRIHEDPDADALGQVAVILKEFDYPIKDVVGASPQTFQKIIRFAHDRPEKLLINSLLLRALKRAKYTDYLGAHFGLASEAYCHFTSPIRRYPDLMVHRLLKAQLRKKLDSEEVASMQRELRWIADHSSSTEREAEAAEDDSTKVKLVELMSRHIDEEFDGIITSVTSFGMFVQLENTAEGLVHVSAMGDDYYRFDAERFELWGEHTGQTYRLGGRVRVRVVATSVADRRIDFELV